MNMFLERKRFLFVFAIALAGIFCSKSERTGPVSNETVTVTYTESEDDFPNPERGFYRYTETRAGNYTPLTISQLQQWRGLSQADGGQLPGVQHSGVPVFCDGFVQEQPAVKFIFASCKK